MSHNARVVVAIFLVLGSSGLSTSAFARSCGHGGGRGDGFRGNHFPGCFGRIPGDSRTGGSHGGLRGQVSRDLWGHWGTYYGPMIPAL